MSEGIFSEVAIFVQSFFAGLLVILAYDLLRIFRRIMKHGVIVIAVEDLVFWIACGLFLFQTLYRINDGVIRWFSISGIAFGMLIYNFSLSNFLVTNISNIVNKILEVIRKFIHIVTTPFRWILKKIFGILKFLYKKIEKFGKFIKKRLKKLIKEVRMLVSKH